MSYCHKLPKAQWPKCIRLEPDALTVAVLRREKVQFIRNEGSAGLARLSSDADLVMLLR